MITTEHIQKQIDKLIIEEASIRSAHEQMMREHQERTAVVQTSAQANANRMQQIAGAISQLKQLLNGQKPPEEPPQPEKQTP
jgi:hypothetical protein